MLERLFARESVPCGRRCCGGCCTETAARAGETVALDVEDLDLANKRARTRSKRGELEHVWGWAPARLLIQSLWGPAVSRDPLS
jgi:integrase/recombinase XerC/integrase/recombinase XerD